MEKTQNSKYNRIFLIGYMGCGKTTVGKELSKLMGYSHVDMDAEIETIEGMPVSKIFMRFGEHEFRNKEAELLDKLCNVTSGIHLMTGGEGAVKKMLNRASLYADFEKVGNSKDTAAVISCGGGIILDDLNCTVLKKECTVFLEGSLPLLFSRIKSDSNRPLAFMDITPEKKQFEKFSDLYSTRKTAYENTALFTLQIDGKTPEMIANEIFEKIV
ncbi:MAG: shikimate kinase [Anaerovorax sp.]